MPLNVNSEETTKNSLMDNPQHVSATSEYAVFKNALDSRNYPALKKVRKADLHAHAFLSAGLEVYRELSPDMPEPPGRFNGFAEFCSWLDKYCVPVTLASYEKVISAAFSRLVEDGVVYAEVSFDYHDALSMRLSIDEWCRLIQSLQMPFSGRLKLCPEFGISREEDPAISLRHFGEAVKTGLFRSIDLYGDEFSRPVGGFKHIYQIAAEAKMKRKAHLGEFGTAADVKEGVEILGLNAVQHGIAAANDPEVMAFLRERGITLNICPSSNLALGRCRSLAEHPIRRLFDHKVRVTLNSDDFMLFRAGVTEEIVSLYNIGLFCAEELRQIVQSGLAESTS